MPLTPATRLGPYEILAPLGAGGMGEVYRARDTRLGREVAIKVLPEHHSTIPEVRSRFEREARTISSLNHPNICSLFDVGRENGIDYLVMELVEGETLARRLEKGALPPAEVLRLGRQIADALDRAHSAGVVHRDLKPGNIMLTRTGAKLLDFGLARPSGLGPAAGMTQSPTMSRPLTAEGSIVGTFQYMAPEQLEGREADPRTDLWAFGCVLYEMVTGQPAFARDSQASLIAAIMTGEPRSMSELQPMTPAGLEKVVRQCLQKDPDLRLQSARDLAFTLDLLGSDERRSAVNAAAAPAAARRPGFPWRTAAIGAVLALAGFAAGRWTNHRAAAPGSVRVSTLSQGTRDSEVSVSPDGRLVAFNAIRQNGQGIWVMDMASRSEVKLTTGSDRLPRFTADGASVLFTRARDNQPSLWRVPVIGGTPRLVLDDASDGDPSPAGDRIAYISGTSDSGRTRLMVAKSDGTGAREVWARGSSVIVSPRWSADGRRIAAIATGVQNSPNAVIVVDVASGTARNYPSPHRSTLSSPIWDGTGHGIIVVEGEGIIAVQRGAPGRLLQLDTRSGKFTELAWLENFPSWIDLLPDGRLVMSGFLARINLREVSLGARRLEEGRTLTSGIAIDRQPVYSPDGRTVMFSSNRGGTLDLWEVSVETGEMHRVTDDPADDWDPEYSPDGSTIYWCSSRSGAFEIWTARRDGSAPRQLSRDSLDAENPNVTPDNRWVFYSSSHPAKAGLWRVPAAGGEPEHVLRATTLIPDLSPDGRFVSTITGVGTIDPQLRVHDLEQGRWLARPIRVSNLLSGVVMGRSRFTPDGRSVVYVEARQDGRPVLLRRPLAAWQDGSGTIDTLFSGAAETIESFGFSPDGKRATVAVLDWLTSLTIAERVPGIVPPKRER